MITGLQSSFAMKCIHADIRLRSASIGHGVSAEDMSRVQEIWQNLSDKGKLPQFEGTILNALDFVVSDDGVTIECGLMLYRCLVARSYEKLPTIKPVAVSGFVENLSTVGRAILLGRRSADASTHSGWYETPPSGGLEAADVNSDGSIDVTKRLANELFEETRIKRNAVESLNMFGVYYDDPTGTIDIIIRLGVSGPAVRVNPTSEYSELRWAEPTEILSLTKRSDAQLVDTSRWILKQWLDEQA
jgi:hypothetical protein